MMRISVLIMDKERRNLGRWKRDEGRKPSHPLAGLLLAATFLIPRPLLLAAKSKCAGQEKGGMRSSLSASARGAYASQGWARDGLHCGRHHAVRVEDEFLGSALVEVLVALGGVVQGDDGGIDGLGDLDLVVQDGHHKLAVVAHDRALAGGEGVGFGPAQADADA